MAADKFLTVPYTDRMREIIREAANRDGRSVAGFIKHQVNLKLQEMGYLDEDFGIIADREPAKTSG